MKLRKHIRVLPIFIFFAVLTLSVKINNIFDSIKNPERNTFSVSQSSAWAEDKNVQETAKLSKVLEQNDQIPDGLSTGGTDPNNGFSSSEIMILQELAERREAMDVRSKEIDRKAIQLKVAEEEIDKKIKQLQEYEQRLKKLITEYNAKEKEKVDSLVKLYSTMKPKDAARIFNTLDMGILVPLLKEMKPSVSSAILSQMNADKARAVTTELVGNNF